MEKTKTQHAEHILFLTTACIELRGPGEDGAGAGEVEVVQGVASLI